MCKNLNFSPNIGLLLPDLVASYSLLSLTNQINSYAIDALSMIDWVQWDICAFPPFSVIPLVLQKVIADKSTSVLIVPHWPTQVWYPTLCKLMAQPPTQ